MCIVAIFVGISTKFPFFTINLREEDPNRPTIQPRKIGNVIEPKDEKEGGTWTSMNTDLNIFTVLTNMNPEAMEDDDPTRSRGKLVSSFATGLEPGMNDLKKNKDLYNGFNLFHGQLSNLCKSKNSSLDNNDFYFFTNRTTDLHKKIKNPIPPEILKPPFQIVFSSEGSFLFEKPVQRIIDFQNIIKEDLKEEDFEQDVNHLLKKLSIIGSKVFEDEEYDEEEEAYSKTRTQIITILEKNGKMNYFYRNTDKMNKIEALKGENWELIEAQLNL